MRYLFVMLFMLLLVSPVHALDVAGRILLDVERNGEAWYVDPVSGSRAYLGRPEAALSIMRTYGLGISNFDLLRFDQDLSLRRRLAGRILLQVESRGEAFYVDPVTLQKFFLGRPTDAFRVMTEHGLGITSALLSTIPIAGDVSPSQNSVVISDVPFVAQAPFGDWNDVRQKEACEEASVYMAVQWARGVSVIDPTVARDEFIRVSDWEEERWGTFHDTSAKDTVERLFKGYYGFEQVELQEDISTEDIHAALKNGYLVLVPVDGTVLENPFYTPPGPLRHMIVMTGFDAERQEFISHDPGTSRGKDIRYSEANIRASLRDYASGMYAPLPPYRTAMILVKKQGDQR